MTPSQMRLRPAAVRTSESEHSHAVVVVRIRRHPRHERWFAAGSLMLDTQQIARDGVTNPCGGPRLFEVRYPG